MLDLRVSIAGGVHLDLVKRVLRDIDRSGQDPATIVQQVPHSQPIYQCRLEKCACLPLASLFLPHLCCVYDVDHASLKKIHIA